MINYFKNKFTKFNQARKNKNFNKLSKEQQIVAIAKDVIEQLQANVYRAAKGNYIGEIKLKGKDMFVYDNDSDVQSQFNNIERCEVCAMGACLMSATKFKNELTFGDTSGYLNSERDKKLFQSLFTPEQLLLIEHAFEGYSRFSCRLAHKVFGLEPNLDEETANKVNAFSDKFNHRERLIAIMENIIENNGTFKP